MKKIVTNNVKTLVLLAMLMIGAGAKVQASTPSFIGANTVTLCQNSPSVSINANLQVLDVSLATVIETWTITGNPSHGTLGGFNYSTTFGGGIINPVGLTYTPTNGFNGTDNFTIQVSNGTNTATQTVSVIINPLPTVGANASLTVCSGTSVTLAGTGANTYSWTGGITNNVAFPATTTTTYTVTGILSSTGCSNTATRTVTVNPSPTPTITGGPIFNCSGTLYTGTYSSYLWNTGSTSSSITINTSGPYSVTVTDGNGCAGTASQNVLVNAIPPPTITSFSPASAVVGTSVTITGTGFNTTTTNNIVFFGATMATVTAASATSVTVTVPSGATHAPITLLNTCNSLATYSNANFNPIYSPAKMAITAADFSPKQDFATGTQPYSVAVGDIDGDGKPDLVSANSGNSGVSILLNTSSSGMVSFAIGLLFPTGGTPVAVTIGDIDGDGKPDLAVANFNGNNVSVLRNNSSIGSISFETAVNVALGSSPGSVAIGDIDGDGKPDLACVLFNSNSVSVLRNTGSSGTISFAAPVNISTGTNPYSVAIGDINGDGKSDLAVANFGSNTVSVFRNTSSIGTVSFAAKVDFTTGSNPVFVAIGDIDGDGKPDLGIANYGVSTISVLLNTGTIGTVNFAGKVDFATGTNPTSISIGDIDGNGKPDLAIANNGSNTVSVLRNTSSIGTVSFASQVTFATATQPRSVALCDIDGDGKPDLSTANYGANNVSVLRNTDLLPTITSFTPTSAVVGTSVTLTGMGFNTTTTNNIVFFGATRATITAATATSVTATVPSGATYAPITLLNASNNLAAYSNANFNPIYSPEKTAFTGADFLPKFDFGTGIFPAAVAIGDFDGDGKPDMVEANYNASTFSIARNTSSSGSINGSSFAGIADFSAGSGPISIALGDLDGDGKLDVVVANANSNTISVCRNYSFGGPIVPGSFPIKVDFATGTTPYSVAIGDLDGDGKLDLVVANNTSNTVSVYRNTSSIGSIVPGSFAAPVDFATGNNPISVAIGDLDGDGKPDLAVANSGSATLSVYRNTSSTGSIDAGSFAAPVDFATGTTPYSVVIGDLDGDSKADLAVANFGSNSISVFHNTSSSGSIDATSFAAKVDFASGNNPISLTIGDLDGNGKPDLAVANYGSNTVSVYRNTSSSGSISTSSFAAKVDFATGANPRGVAIGDLDGDGKPDLAAVNLSPSTVSVFRNTYVPPTITSFSPASGAVGSLVTITGTYLSSPTAITIGGVTAIVVSNTGSSLVAMVMPGATTGLVSITTVGGTANGTGNFNVTASQAPNAQQGNKLVATGNTGAAQQGYSSAISADGNTAIVGGPFDNNNQGAAWVYTRSGNTWSQQGNKLVGTGNVGAANQGYSVAISADGNTAIVGGWIDNSNQGAAWVYTRSGSTWSQQGSKLVGTGNVGAARQGASVSISADGNTAIVGGHGDNSSNGAAWIFTRSGSTWSQLGNKLVGTGNVGAAQQGGSVAISADGNTAIVGGTVDNEDGNNHAIGAAWIFTLSGNTWSQQGGKLVGTGGDINTRQGVSVAISADGNTAVVGGYGDNSNQGAAWVFNRSGSTWSQQGNKLVGTGNVGNARQGTSVSISADGNTAIVGGPVDNSNQGAVWVYTRSGSTWSQVGNKLVGTGNTGTARQGQSLSISADGNTTIVGGPIDNSAIGAAWVYTYVIPPAITTSGTLSAFNTCVGVASTEQSFTIAGSNLIANLVLTPPTGYELSTTSGTGFASSVSLTPSSGNVNTTTIYVRLTNSATGTPSGNIICSSTGATPQNIAVTGVVVVTLTPTITGGTIFAGSGTLYAGNYSTYLWSTGSTSSSISVNTTGTYSVTVTYGNGCSGNTSQYVIVNAQSIASGCASNSSYILCSVPGIPQSCGYNSTGQLGDGTSTDRNTLVTVSGLSSITAMAGGDGHSLYLKSDGTVWASGRNNAGQLGDGTTTDRSTPIQVIGLSNITAIAAGISHSIFLKSDGTVWACGSNNHGQLGDGTTTDRSTVVQVSDLSNITAISSGQEHALFLKSDGTVWACGSNVWGQLGDGTTTDRSTAVQISGLNNVISISAGAGHSVYLKSDGTVWACGFNLSGQLGNGTNTNSNIPIQMNNLSGIIAISTGSAHDHFIKSDGTVWACGLNFSGQLGIGTNFTIYSPVQISGLTNITAISEGYSSSLFLKSDGTVWASGRNNAGQLGNGTNTDSNIPVQMLTGPTSVTASSNSPICSGATLNLTASTSNPTAATYLWSGTGTFSDTTAQSPTVTGAATGTYSVTISSGCGTATASVSVVVNSISGIAYVNAAASGSNDGSSWANAFTDLQSALNYPCSTITQIWVAAGTYKPTSGSNQHVSFIMRSGVGMYGGFNGTETLLSQRNWNTNPTILSGNINNPSDSTDNTYHVIFNDNNNLDSTARLDGFIVRDGFAIGNLIDNDPNIYYNASYGGGIKNEYSSPAIYNCTFTHNTAGSGAGVFCHWGANTIISGCNFFGNHANASGSGVATANTNSTITNCSFTHNIGIGAISNGTSTCLVYNTLIADNNGVTPAMRNQSSTVNLVNCTVANNIPDSGSGYLHQNNGSLNISNCIVWGNGGNLTTAGPSSIASNNSITQDGLLGTGNLNTDPMFVDAANGDYHVQLCLSPAINAGNNADVPVTITTDLDGNARIQQTTVDMGAYENQTTPIAGIAYVNAAATGSNDGTSWANAFTDLQSALNYPCSTITQIWVAAGTYKPTSGSDQHISFIMRNGVGMYGGFNGTETLLSQRNWNTNPTILSGNINNLNDSTDNTYHVIYNVNNNLDSTARLDGFIVRDGFAINNLLDNPSTIYSSNGGGIENWYSSPAIYNCTFTYNTAGLGAGISFNYGANQIISNCKFFGNELALGTGVAMIHTNGTIINCSFTHNNGLGAIHNSVSTCLVYNTLIADNNGVSPAMRNQSSTVNLVNCTVANNMPNSGTGYLYQSNGSLNISNSIVWGNGGNITTGGSPSIASSYSITQDGLVGTGNLNTDPMFVDTTNENYHLKLCLSPAINAGNNADVPVTITTDLDGNARIYNSDTVDMGAYEMQSAGFLAPVITASGPTTFCAGDSVTLSAPAAGIIDQRFVSTVINFSSEYTATDWSANQLIGAPDVYPYYGDANHAWASLNPDDSREYLELGYASPAPINFIDIYETFAPGAVDTVYVKNPNTGLFEIVYTATAAAAPAAARILHITFPETSFNVSEIRIAINSSAVPDWNEIDAVAIGKEDTYLWSTGAITPSITVSTSGTFTVTVTNTNGCTASSSATTIVNANPTPAISGALSFCNGSSTTLDAGSYSSYLWSTGATTQTITANTASTFTVTVTNASGCTGSTTIATTVNANPTPAITGSLSFCAGSSTILNAGSGYSTYNWSTGATTQTITANTAGTFTVTVTNASGCSGSTTIATTVNANPTPAITGSLSFCAGSSTTLNAGSGYTSYNWSTGATTQTITANTASTFTVMVTNASGCSGSTIVSTTVNANPTPAITGSLSFCAGSSTTLNAGSGYSAYNWSTGATTQTITANTAGTFTVTVTNASGCSSSSIVSTTVNANPSPAITGSLSFCAGSSTTLNAGSGYTSYNWSTGATTQTITANTASTFTVTVTNASGCSGSTTIATTVNANPTPAITGSLSFCAGSSTTLNAGSGYSAYNWSTGATTQAISVNTSGTYAVTVTNSFGCTGTKTKTITVNALPVVSITGATAFCAPGSTTLNAGLGYSTYLWDNGSTNVTRSVSASGTYTVTVTNASGCSASANKTITSSNASPNQPGAITGAAAVCKNSTTSYSIGAVPGATSYTWTAISGASISTGQGSTNVTVSFSNIATAASLSVVATNACGTSIARTLAYSMTSALPSQPSTINGPLYGVCNQINVAYNCPVAANASSYTWTVPTGVTLLTGQGTKAITVKYTSSFSGTGTISVVAESGCGSSAATSRTVNAKPQQSVITGLNWACKGQPGLVYSVAPVTGATSYTWTAVNGSTIVSGQGTTSIVVNWGGINGVIKCTANNACGSSIAATLAVSFTCKEAGTNEDFSELSLYPNPASANAELQFEGFAEGKGEIAIYDMIGSQVLKQDLAVTTGNNNYKLDLSAYPTGAYIVRVTYNGVVRNCKLIIQ